MRILWIDTSESPWQEGEAGWQVLSTQGFSTNRVHSYEDAKAELDHNTFDVIVVAVEVTNSLRFVDEVKCHAKLWRTPLIVVSNTWGQAEFKNHASQPTAAEQYASLPVAAEQFIAVAQSLVQGVGNTTDALPKSKVSTQEEQEADPSPIQFNLEGPSPADEDRSSPTTSSGDEASRLLQTGVAENDQTVIGFDGIPFGDNPSGPNKADEGLAGDPAFSVGGGEFGEISSIDIGGPSTVDENFSIQFEQSPGSSPKRAVNADQSADQATHQAAGSSSAPGEADTNNDNATDQIFAEADALGKKRPQNDENLYLTKPLSPAMTTSPEAEQTVRGYLQLREQELANVLLEKEALEDGIEQLRTELKAIEKEKRKYDAELEKEKAHTETLQRELDKIHQQFAKEKDDLAFQKKMADDRAEDLERTLVTAKEKYEALKKRVRRDIQRISQRERELEAKLELSRKDAEAIVRARDEEVIRLKRKIDALEFDLDQVQDSKIQAKAEADRYIEKLLQIARTLNVAIGMIETEQEEKEDLFEADPLIGGAAAEEFPELAKEADKGGKEDPSTENLDEQAAEEDQENVDLSMEQNFEGTNDDFGADPLQADGFEAGSEGDENEFDQFNNNDDSDFALG